MKNYKLEQIEELMKLGQKVDMSRVSMKELNPVAYQYIQDCEKGENKAREQYLKVLLSPKCDPVKCLAGLQLYDFTKNSKEGVRYNFAQFENKIKQYNSSLEAKKENKGN